MLVAERSIPVAKALVRWLHEGSGLSFDVVLWTDTPYVTATFAYDGGCPPHACARCAFSPVLDWKPPLARRAAAAGRAVFRSVFEAEARLNEAGMLRVAPEDRLPLPGLHAVRMRASTSLAHLARLTSIPVATLSRYDRDLHACTLADARVVARALAADVDELWRRQSVTMVQLGEQFVESLRTVLAS